MINIETLVTMSKLLNMIHNGLMNTIKAYRNGFHVFQRMKLPIQSIPLNAPEASSWG